jgi:hypothetical protein
MQPLSATLERLNEAKVRGESATASPGRRRRSGPAIRAEAGGVESRRSSGPHIGQVVEGHDSASQPAKSLGKMAPAQYENTKPCEVCGLVMRPRWQDSPDAQRRGRARHAFKSVRTCSPKCQGELQRRDPARQAKTRSGAANTAKRLLPKRPCERCGETRQSQVHHKNRDWLDNRLENLERLCKWCHAKEHSPEYAASSQAGWETRRHRMETAEIVRRLRECAERAGDAGHPKGWLTYWSDAEVELVEQAADAIERLEDL